MHSPCEDKKRKSTSMHAPPPKKKRKGGAQSQRFGQGCKQAAAECKASGGTKKYCGKEVSRCYIAKCSQRRSKHMPTFDVTELRSRHQPKTDEPTWSCYLVTIVSNRTK
jgi:hypothetical protein